MEPLLYFLNSIYPLSDELQEYLYHAVQLREIPAEHYSLKAGWVCDKICFIIKGIFRCYYLKNDEEVCAWFMKEGDVMISVFSFFDQVPSYESIQALEDSVVFYISHKEYEFIKKNFLEFNIIIANRLEYYYKLSEQRAFSMRMQNAKDRFQYLFNNQRELVDRIPDKYLASYLGITASTFSRNKARFFKEQ